jgi:hypothetical protein
VFILEPWEEIEEYPETAKRIREDPEGWVPVSYEEEIEDVGGRFREIMKEQAERGLGRDEPPSTAL